MPTLSSLKKICGKKKAKGVKTRVYYTVAGELNGYPDSLPDGVQGNSQRLDGAFDFSNAPSGAGYWRELDILVDTGDVLINIEGEVGGQEHKNSFKFFVEGTDAPQLEFSALMTQYSGCLLWLVPGKNGLYYVVGDIDSPAFVEAGEGGTGGDKNGMSYTVYAKTGLPPMLYDAETNGIDITPNP